MLNIEQPKNDKPGRMPPPSEAPNTMRRFIQAEGGSQNRGWGKKSKAMTMKTILFLSWGREGTLNQGLPRGERNLGENKKQNHPTTSIAT